ncbi:MAG: MATE family efflux transporter [Clostridia bacterium]|nr:MATE family efflux transporter [Clostridia bacterium]
MDKRKITNGPILKTLVAFAIPFIMVNLVQRLFHIADVAVLGIMATDTDVAAVGACGSIISMMICIFMGYSSAANVVVARYVGAGDESNSRKAAGTALIMGFLSGVILMLIAMIFARDILILTKCQPEVLDLATLYMKIYFAGMPVTMLYNFVAALLRATGDSVRPMIYMIISGVANVGLNVVFVGFLGLAVAGVALATVLSNVIALVLGLIALAKNKDYCKIERKNLVLRKKEFLEMLKIGFPICICGLSFYVGEVIVISAVNSISTNAMTANTLASQIDVLVYNIGSSIAVATGVMISQNFGAKNLDRVKKLVNVGSAFLISVTLSVGIIGILLSKVIFGIMTENPEVIKLAMERCVFVCLTNFITCEMEIFSNALRAMKHPNWLLVVGISCGFVVRSVWALFIWPLYSEFYFLFVCLPLSTLIGTIIYIPVYFRTMKQHRLDFAKVREAVAV